MGDESGRLSSRNLAALSRVSHRDHYWDVGEEFWTALEARFGGRMTC